MSSVEEDQCEEDENLNIRLLIMILIMYSDDDSNNDVEPKYIMLNDNRWLQYFEHQ